MSGPTPDAADAPGAGDRRAFLCVSATLAAVGLTVAHSTAMADADPARTLAKCCVLLAVAAAAGAVCAVTPAAWVRRALPWALAGTLILLVLVLIPGVGVKSGGARRWLRVGGVSVQPAELAKLVGPAGARVRAPSPPRRVLTGQLGLRIACGGSSSRRGRRRLCAGLIAAGTGPVDGGDGAAAERPRRSGCGAGRRGRSPPRGRSRSPRPRRRSGCGRTSGAG